MSYNPNIPQANDLISTSQGDLLANFGQIDDGVSTGIANDHVSLTDGTATNRGRHANIRFVEQAGDAATPVDQVGLYAKDTGGTPRLYIREENNGTVYQFNGVTPVVANPGTTWLPGGLILNYGNVALAGSAQTAYNFATAFPTTLFSLTISVQANIGGSPDTDVFIRLSSLSGFTLRNSTGQAWTVHYIAIGN